jgi:hypothetical protein
MAKKRRKLTDLEMDDLKDLRSFLEDAFEAFREPTIPPYPYDRRTNTISLPEKVDKEIKHVASTEGLPQAVKKVAYLTGARLGLSKSYVDNLLGRNVPQQNQGKRGKGKRK